MMRACVFVVVGATGAGCDEKPAEPQAPALPQCMVISRPTSTAFVSTQPDGTLLRMPITRPPCVVYQPGALAWADDGGVHVRVGERTVDVKGDGRPLRARFCLPGVAVGRGYALAETADGIVAVSADGVTPAVLPPLEPDEYVSSARADGSIVVTRGKARARSIGRDGSPSTTITGPEGKAMGHIDGNALILDDGRRIDVDFPPAFADGRGRVVVAIAGKRVRGFIGNALVYRSEDGANVVGMNDDHLFRADCQHLVRVDEAGVEVVVVAPQPGVTVGGAAFEGVRETTEFAMDRRGRILVRERLRGFDCTLRDAVTLIDDAGAHVVADGEGARANVGFWNGAPVWVESTLSYEALAEANGTSEP